MNELFISMHVVCPKSWVLFYVFFSSCRSRVVDGVNCSRQTHVITVTNGKLVNRGGDNHPIGTRDAQSAGKDVDVSSNFYIARDIKLREKALKNRFYANRITDSLRS